MSEYEGKTMRTIADEKSKSAPHENAEAQIAHAIVDLLDEHAQHLHASVAGRLASARSLAVSQVADAQGVNQSGNTLQLFGGNVGQYLAHHRFMSFILVGIIVLSTIFTAQQFGFNNNLEDSDAFLLASDLPPEAYADKGFDTWLDTTAE